MCIVQFQIAKSAKVITSNMHSNGSHLNSSLFKFCCKRVNLKKKVCPLWEELNCWWEHVHDTDLHYWVQLL